MMAKSSRISQICKAEADTCPHSLLSSLHLGIRTGGARSLDEAPQTQVVDDVLDPLDVVLYAVGALADDVVLEVEQLEAGEEVLCEGADDEGQLEVAEGDCVCGEAGEVRGEVCEGEEVFFYGEVEGVAGFEVCRDFIFFLPSFGQLCCFCYENLKCRDMRREKL